MNQRSGLFVSVDGPNGVGKSTLIKAIGQNLRKEGISVHLTKEVTGTALGTFIRNMHEEYRGKTLALLIAADRQNHIEEDILPALRNHDVVITDRYVDSSLVFQRLDGVELSFLWKLNADFLTPALSIAVVAPVEVIASRMKSRETYDRFEKSFSGEAELRFFREAASFMCQRSHRSGHLGSKSIRPPEVRKSAFSLQKPPCNALLWSFLERKCSFLLRKVSDWFQFDPEWLVLK